MHGEAERAREAVHVGIDVESLELQADVARRGEKRAGVTADLDSGAAPAKCPEQTTRLPSIGTALSVVQALKQFARRRRVGVDGVELVRPLDRISIDQSTSRALDEPKGWMLGECDAIHEPLGRRRGAKPPAVKGPQQLDFLAYPVGVGDLFAVLATTRDARRDLVSRRLRVHTATRVQELGRESEVGEDSPVVRAIAVRHARGYGIFQNST